jgi:hypothetical protein
MAGAPSQLELFDYKPELKKLEGHPLPPSVIGGQRYAFIRSDANVLGPQFTFAKKGKCGAEISEVLPHLAEIVDDICLIKSMQTDQFNHAPAQIYLNTGFARPGRPSLGSWAFYGLGNETQDLPAFVVMSTGTGISGGSANWSNGFMPSLYAGVRFRNQGDPILTCPAQRELMQNCSAIPLIWLRNSTVNISGQSVIRRSRPASPRTKWPIGCSLPRRN